MSRGVAGDFRRTGAKARGRRKWRITAAICATLAWTLASAVATDLEHCFVCGNVIKDIDYSFKDRVTLDKRHVCAVCEESYPSCFLCGIPAATNAPGFQELPDGRVICGRDSKTAVLGEEEGAKASEEVKQGLEREFSRFLTLPDTNVVISMMDRIHLQEMFRFAGNDYECPNVWGYFETRTNRGKLEHHISLLTGLPLSWLQATCAHEFGHLWVKENVSENRRETLGRDAEEGFCELLAYLYMDTLHDPDTQNHIMQNKYTRGQIDLFVSAEKQFGLNEILDWIRFGTDDKLDADDPGRVRKVEVPEKVASAPGKPLPTSAAQAQKPRVLTLKAVFWTEKNPLVLINDKTLGVKDEQRFALEGTNVLVRCLEIRKNAVKIRLLDSGEERELILKGN